MRALLPLVAAIALPLALGGCGLRPLYGGGTHGARRLSPMNANLARIVAIELMAAAEGIDFRRPLASSALLEDAHRLVRSKAAKRDEDREFATDTEAVANLIEAGAFARFVPDLLGDLGCR